MCICRMLASMSVVVTVREYVGLLLCNGRC